MQDLFSYIKCRRILQPDIIIRIKKGDKKRCSQKQKNRQYGGERCKNVPEKQTLVVYRKTIIKHGKINTLDNNRLVLKILD